MAFDLVNRCFACLLLGLRVAPVFALAPPFAQLRAPAPFRVLFGLGATACVMAAAPALTQLDNLTLGHIIEIAVRELMLGTIFVLVFQLMFGMLYVAGRTIDIQAGFGLSLLIDPASKAQTPLVGTLFAYAAGLVFFVTGGPESLLRMMEASLHAVPLGMGSLHSDGLYHVIALLGALAATSFGVAGGAILTLFLADMAIALLSRTIPQMNVLVLGFQVKTLLLLLVLPAAFGASGALFARLAAISLEAIPGLL